MAVSVQKEKDLEALEDQGSNIWVAVADGDMRRVQFLLEHSDVTPTSKDDVHYTPIHAAASYAQHEMLRLLLKNEPNDSVNVEDNEGDTPLFFCDNVETAKILVEAFHANAQHKNHEGKTAAENARINGCEELATYLSSITGESLASRTALLARYGEEDDDYEGGLVDQSDNMEQRIEELDDNDETEKRVDEMMERVESVLKRAEETGTDPTEELRELVGASIMRQIMEGYKN